MQIYIINYKWNKNIVFSGTIAIGSLALKILARVIFNNKKH